MDFYESPLAALLYDLQHNGDPVLEAERDFFLEVLEREGGRAIDLGCGTGRILLAAMQRGLDIVGCDLSQPFLERARTQGLARGLRPSLLRCDLREPCLGLDCIEAAICAFRTFDHILEDEARLALLEAVYDALRPAGCLWVNLANPDPLYLESAAGQKMLMRDDLREKESGRSVVWWGVSHFDPDSRQLTEAAQYDFLDETGRIDASYYFPYTMRWTPVEEFETMASGIGFDIAGRWGGFQWETFEIGSGDAIYELRKPVLNR